jgi:8-oxo-dGTP pyrophosphatase MutT (NUDIX family)
MAFPRAFQSYVPRTHCIDSHVYGIILLSPNDEVLLVQGRQSNKWSFPKGHGSALEKPLEAALRELREETGIVLGDRLPDNERRFLSNKSGSGGTYFIFQLDHYPEVNPEDTREIINTMWCLRSRLPKITGNMDLTTFCRRRCHLDPRLADPTFN